MNNKIMKHITIVKNEPEEVFNKSSYSEEYLKFKQEKCKIKKIIKKNR